MTSATVRASLLAALLLSSASPVMVAPAGADDRSCHDEATGACCVWDDVLKRDVSTSCNTLLGVPQKSKAPATSAVGTTQSTSTSTSTSSSMSTSAATAASQDETTYGNPGNDRIGKDGNPVGHAGETPGTNEEGSFGDGIKGRSDVAGGGGGAGSDAGDTGAVASASGGAGATGNNGSGDGTVGNSAGKGKN